MNGKFKNLSKYDISFTQDEKNEKENDVLDISQSELETYIETHQDKIYYISKVGQSKYHSMTLFTSDVEMKADDYIKNYNSIPILYGKNPLNEFDITIIKLFNEYKD